VTGNAASVNRISQMSMADHIVRNDEVVGSIPTSSTMFRSRLHYGRSFNGVSRNPWVWP
jgi:hypothetical protein